MEELRERYTKETMDKIHKWIHPSIASYIVPKLYEGWREGDLYMEHVIKKMDLQWIDIAVISRDAKYLDNEIRKDLEYREASARED